MRADPASARAGIVWMLLAALFFTAESVLIKHLGPIWPAPLQLFWRQTSALVLLLPLILTSGVSLWKVSSPDLVFFRSASGCAGLLCSIYAIAHLPLATANALSFTRPIMLALLAALFLGERLTAMRLAALGLGLVGVGIMLGPDVANIETDLAFAAALAAALLFAASLLSIKMMTADHQPATLLVYGVVLSLMLVSPIAVSDWRVPQGHEVWLFLAMGAASLGTIFCTIRALAAAQASFVAQLDYIRLPLALLAGMVLFAEPADGFTLAGAGLIVAGAWIASRGSGGDVVPASGNSTIKAPAMVMRCAISADEINAFFEAQLADQQAIAMTHIADSYWTDSRTGHNVGKDELAATQIMQKICNEPTVKAHDHPDLYAEWLFHQLDVASQIYRAAHADPDGYGIATIGTVEHNLRRFCYG